MPFNCILIARQFYQLDNKLNFDVKYGYNYYYSFSWIKAILTQNSIKTHIHGRGHRITLAFGVVTPLTSHLSL